MRSVGWNRSRARRSCAFAAVVATLVVLLAGGEAYAADLVAHDTAGPSSPSSPSRDDSRLTVGPAKGPSAFSLSSGWRRAGVAADWALGDDVTLRAEGALAEDPAIGGGMGPNRGALRGRLAYGGGVASLGLRPGLVIPWVEGEQAWTLEETSPLAPQSPAVPVTRFSIGVDVPTGSDSGLSLSAGAESSPLGGAGVSASAGLKLKF